MYFSLVTILVGFFFFQLKSLREKISSLCTNWVYYSDNVTVPFSQMQITHTKHRPWTYAYCKVNLRWKSWMVWLVLQLFLGSLHMLHLSRVFATIFNMLLTGFGTSDSTRNVGDSFHCEMFAFCPCDDAYMRYNKLICCVYISLFQMIVLGDKNSF